MSLKTEFYFEQELRFLAEELTSKQQQTKAGVVKFPYFLEREQCAFLQAFLWISFTDTNVFRHTKSQANVVKCLHKLFLDHVIMSVVQKSNPNYYMSVRQDNLSYCGNQTPPPQIPTAQHSGGAPSAPTYKTRMNYWGVRTVEGVNWLHRMRRQGIKKKQRASDKLFSENYYVGMTFLKQTAVSKGLNHAGGSGGDSRYKKALVSLSSARKGEIGGERR